MQLRTDVTHPAWCATHDDPPEFDDSVHLGPPRRFTAEADNVDLTMQLCRWDVRPGHCQPQQIGPAGAHLAVANHAPRPDGTPLAADVFLTPSDLRALARRFDAMADEAQGATDGRP